MQTFREVNSTNHALQTLIYLKKKGTKHASNNMKIISIYLNTKNISSMKNLLNLNQLFHLIIILLINHSISTAQVSFKPVQFDGSHSHKYNWAHQLDYGSEGTIELKFKIKNSNSVIRRLSLNQLIEEDERSGSIALMSIADKYMTRFTVFMNRTRTKIGLYNGEKIEMVNVRLKTGRLHHLVLSTKNDTTTVFLNGQQIATTLNLGYGIGRDLPIYLGSSDGEHHPFIGEMHFARLWKKALSLSDITNLRLERKISESDPLFEELVLYSDFSENGPDFFYAHDPIYRVRVGDFSPEGTYQQHLLGDGEKYTYIGTSFEPNTSLDSVDFQGIWLKWELDQEESNNMWGRLVEGGVINNPIFDGEYVTGIAGTKDGNNIRSLRFIKNSGLLNINLFGNSDGEDPFFAQIPENASLAGIEWSFQLDTTQSTDRNIIKGIGLLYKNDYELKKLDIGHWIKKGEEEPQLDDDLAKHHSHIDLRDNLIQLHGNYTTPAVYKLEMDLENDRITIIGERPRKLTDSVASVVGPFIFEASSDNTYVNEEFEAKIRFNEGDEFELITQADLIQVDTSHLTFASQPLDSILISSTDTFFTVSTILSDTISDDSTIIPTDTVIYFSSPIPRSQMRVDTVLVTTTEIHGFENTTIAGGETTTTPSTRDTTVTIETRIYAILGADSILMSEDFFYDTLFPIPSGIYARSKSYPDESKDKNQWGGTFTLNQKPTLSEFNFMGYNLAKMNPKDYQLGTGSSKMLFKMPEDDSYDYYITTADKIVPYGLTYKNNRNSMFRAHTHMVSSEVDHRNAWSVKAGFNIGVPGMSFGANGQHKESTEQKKKNQQQNTISTAHETKYALIMDRTKMELSEEFRTAVLDLRKRFYIRGPLETNINNPMGTMDIMEFFEIYGTHYPYAVTYGGMAYQEVDYSKDEIISKHTSETDLSAEASGTIEGITLGISGGGGTSDESEFSNVVEDKTAVAETIGGEISFGGEGIGWTLPDKSEVPVFLDLRPITELFSPLYFDDETIYEDLREMVHDSLVAYEKKYPASSLSWAKYSNHVELEVVFETMTDSESGDIDNKGEWGGSFFVTLDMTGATMPDSSVVLSHKDHGVWTATGKSGLKDGETLKLNDSPEKFKIYLTDLDTCRISISGVLTEYDDFSNPDDQFELDQTDILNCADFSTTKLTGTLIFNELNDGGEHATINYSFRRVEHY